MKFGRIVLQLQVNTHRRSLISDMTLYFQDGGHDVISRRKVLSPDECARIVRPASGAACAAAMQQCPLAILSAVPDT